MSCHAASNSQACLCGSCAAAQTQRAERRQQLRSLYALPLYSLPPELILVVLNHLDLNDYPSMIAATYHLLQHHGITPHLSTTRRIQLVRRLNGPWRECDISPFLFLRFYGRLRTLPAELGLEIQNYLTPQDKINFVFAMYGWRTRASRI